MPDPRPAARTAPSLCDATRPDARGDPCTSPTGTLRRSWVRTAASSMLTSHRPPQEWARTHWPSSPSRSADCSSTGMLACSRPAASNRSTKRSALAGSEPPTADRSPSRNRARLQPPSARTSRRQRRTAGPASIVTIDSVGAAARNRSLPSASTTLGLIRTLVNPAKADTGTSANRTTGAASTRHRPHGDPPSPTEAPSTDVTRSSPSSPLAALAPRDLSTKPLDHPRPCNARHRTHGDAGTTQTPPRTRPPPRNSRNAPAGTTHVRKRSSRSRCSRRRSHVRGHAVACGQRLHHHALISEFKTSMADRPGHERPAYRRS
jgi:hypothetical protein